ncbi:MAG TPA: glycosyltransferase family 4 protein [Sphingobacteriaceae bacterium]
MRTMMYHPTGNANVRAAALGLVRAGLLEEFHTSIATFQSGNFDFLGRIGLAELTRRRFHPLLKDRTFTHPWPEAGRLLAQKAGLGSLTRHESGPLSTDAVYRSLDTRMARIVGGAAPRLDAVYAYEDGALLSFLASKHHGLRCIYDLPIGYWRSARQLLQAEKERWPDWAPTLIGFQDSQEKLARKDQELKLADHIMVASRFTAATLEAYPGSTGPVTVIPYGFPPVPACRNYDTPTGRPLRLLFVGALSQRKGIADLFAAAAAFGRHVQLTVIGHRVTSECPALDRALAGHKWIPSLPHEGILQQMKAHDVLVFPSLFEGFGLVITEAMSQGTPVITTERTAGPDLIRHGENGWLIRAGSTPDLVKIIEEILGNPGVTEAVGMQAMETARKRPWERYGQELARAVSNLTCK